MQNDTISSHSNESSLFTEGQRTDQGIQPASLRAAESGKGSPLYEEKEQPIDRDVESNIDLSLTDLPSVVPHRHRVFSSKADKDDAKLSATDPHTDIADISEAHHDLMAKLMRRVHAMLAFGVESVPYSGACRQDKQQETKRQGNKRKRLNAPGQDQDSDRGSCSPSRDEDSDRGRSRYQYVKSQSPRPLACPFYKYNPWKYCENSTTGKKYRTCGKGFEDMRRLK